MKYELGVASRNNKFAEYFFVTPTTGMIHLKKFLTEDEGRDTQYRVRTYSICYMHLFSMKHLIYF